MPGIINRKKADKGDQAVKKENAEEGAKFALGARERLANGGRPAEIEFGDGEDCATLRNRMAMR